MYFFLRFEEKQSCSYNHFSTFSIVLLLSEKAEDYKNRGNEEYRKREFKSAIHLYTEGIKVNCKDDELNAKLYNNRSTAHFYLGEMFLLIFFFYRC